MTTNKPKSKESCSNCSYWTVKEKDRLLGTCCRYPAALGYETVTLKDRWCGEWSEK